MEQEVSEKISEKIEKGGVHCRAICEILGGPKEFVEESIKLLVDKAKELPYGTLIKAEVFPTKEVDKMFSSFAEIEIVFKNKESIFDFCYSFMPSSIEIIEPGHLEVTSAELSNLLNDFMSRLHTTDRLAKEANAIKKLLSQRQAQVIRYNMLSHLKDRSLTEEELKDRIGIDQDSFTKYLNVLIKRGEIEKKGKNLKLTEVVKFNESEEQS